MRHKSFRAVALALLALRFALGDPSGAQAGQSDRFFVYVGTYTGPKSKGIYSFKYQAGIQRFDLIGLAAINQPVLCRQRFALSLSLCCE